jgi:VIT1/CCC1 family predicted Fe2+/Mn2+ transporter
MGNKQSMVTDIVNNFTMTTTSDYVTKNVLNMSTDVTNAQDLVITIGIADGCPVSASQTIKSKVSVKQSIDQQATKDLATKLQANLENALDQNSKMINGLAGATGNSQDVRASIRNTINQSIQTRVTTENIMNIATSSVNLQSGKLSIAVCRNSPIRMDQNIESDVVAQNLMTQITDDILKNEAIASAKNTVKQTAFMENKGLEAIAGACAGSSAIIGVILLLACVAMMMMGGSAKTKGGHSISAPGIKKFQG